MVIRIHEEGKGSRWIVTGPDTATFSQEIYVPS